MAYVLKNLRILLVEDDFTMRELLRDVLKAFDVGEIRTAHDGNSAIQELRHFSADIVIIDWHMAPMDGLECLKYIRHSHDTPNPFVPVIMLTAYSDKPRVLASRDAGITNFMAKPVTAKRLYNRIVAVIEDDRNYIRTSDFFGPDRRRVVRPFQGQDRREQQHIVMLD